MTLRRRPLVASCCGVLALAIALVAYRSVTWARFQDEVDGLAVDLSRPDALIRTHSLTQLPRDLLKVPLAHDALSEDLLFYYEENPDRLGLKGSLRRIAYEHELSWGDELLAWVLDQPAEIALWRAGDGRLRHWAVAIARPQLVKVLQEAAAVALKSDRQLTRAGEVSVGGSAVPVLALEFSANRTLLVAGHGERVVVLSDPGLLLDPAGVREAPKAVVEKLLSGEAVFSQSFGIPAQGPSHSVLVRAHYLSFGYQRFFPALQALRFDFGWDGWSTQVLFEGAPPPPARELWSSLPTGAAACAMLPVDWSLGKELAEQAPALAAELDGPAAVCWYPDGRLQAPLFAGVLKKPRPELEPLFASLFGWSVSADEEGEAEPRKEDGAVVWSREVEVPFATLSSEGEPQPGSMSVTLAWKGKHVFFSPDGKRVEQALATAAKRYPSLADSLPAEAVTLGVVSPKALSDLGKVEALGMLPREHEPVFRDAAERLLLPRLEALARHPSYRLTLPAAASAGWQAVEWQEMAR